MKMTEILQNINAVEEVTVKVTGEAKKNEQGIWTAPAEITIFYAGNTYEKISRDINVTELYKG